MFSGGRIKSQGFGSSVLVLSIAGLGVTRAPGVAVPFLILRGSNALPFWRLALRFSYWVKGVWRMHEDVDVAASWEAFRASPSGPAPYYGAGISSLLVG